MRIYLEELQQLYQQLRVQNEETTALLIDHGHGNIREQLKLFQIKYISQKIGELLPWFILFLIDLFFFIELSAISCSLIISLFFTL